MIPLPDEFSLPVALLEEFPSIHFGKLSMLPFGFFLYSNKYPWICEAEY